ncbi:cell division protein DivIC [Lachnospiraceae bacterium C7]|nr:cell division protein DivIC [Lachnospiraceae bacterium C7]
MSTKRRTKGLKAGVIAGAITLVFVGVMSYQTYTLKKQNEAYAQEQQTLKKELKEEKTRKKDIKKYEKYTKSQEYIEDVAKSKLGLANDNEIIFKEESK